MGAGNLRERKHCDKSPKSAVIVEERGYLYPDHHRKYYFKINNYSSYNLLKAIRAEFSDVEKAMFRSTAVGRFLDIPNDQKMYGPIFSFLMTRRIFIPKDKDIWFKVRGKEIRFGKREFAAISGLSLTKYDTTNNQTAESSKLKAKYFSSLKRVQGLDLHDFLFLKTVAVDGSPNNVKDANKNKERLEVDPDDRVKVELLYVVHRFLYGHQNFIGVEEFTWDLVDDIVRFNNYPWGDVVYHHTVEKITSAFNFQVSK